MTIKAAIFRAPGVPFSVERLDLEAPRAGEVLVRIRAVGVCHSDWHLMTGATKHPVPAVPGHEGAGVVESIGGGVTGVAVGDHVSLNWAPNCGHCFYCLHERPSLCSAYVEPIWAGTMLDGTTRLSQNGEPLYHFSALACFAEYAVVPQECCVRMPSDLPFPVAALIGCAVTTGVGSVLNTAKVRAGSSVAVFGAGGVGLSTIMGARVAGANPIVAVDVAPEKLQVAKGFGATHGVLSGPHTVERIRELTEGRGADYAFEAVGIPAVQEQCLKAVRPGGTVVFSGISPMGSATNLPGAVLTRQEKTVMGSYYGTAHAARDFPLYGEMYRRGQLDLDRMITRTYALEEINEAYADMLNGRGARGVVVFE
jgi:NDMA-dependent alcohol dehydrogenase